MAKVLTFSRTFPKYHPKAGEPTYFVEKIYAGLADTIPDFEIGNAANEFWDFHIYYNAEPKLHTIRAGNRWKVGDKFSPRVWSGKPYASKQIVIAPDIEVKKVWGFEIWGTGVISVESENQLTGSVSAEQMARNDGLELSDFLAWFKYPKPFKGQIICWSDEINY